MSDHCPTCLSPIRAHFHPATGQPLGCPAHITTVVARTTLRPEPVVIRIWRRGDRAGVAFALMPEQELGEGWVRGYTIAGGWEPLHYARENEYRVSRTARAIEAEGILESLGYEGWRVKVTQQWRPRAPSTRS